MTVHHLDPETGTTIDYFSRDASPVLTVDPGDTVIVRSLDASGFLERQQTPGEQRPTMFAEPRGHCLTGPIAVRGAEPGMVLALRIDSLRPDPWGWTVAAARDNLLNRRLGLTEYPPSWLLWEIDADAGTATDQWEHMVRTDPFLGVMGVAPADPGEHSTIPPRAVGGGNIDCRSLGAGSTLYLPVNAPGALLTLGDGHARQGDGEVCGTAIECPMTTQATLDLVTDPAIPGIHAETPSGRITFGFDADLNEAMAQALDAMLGWMQVLYGLDKAAAMALASPTVDLRVTQVANDVWGVHALLPVGAIS
jgi:acetamidase/formamidase